MATFSPQLSEPSNDYNRLDDGRRPESSFNKTAVPLVTSPTEESMELGALEMSGHERSSLDCPLTFSDRLLDAAMQAELEETEFGDALMVTTKDPTVVDAKAHVMVRTSRIVLGFFCILLGILALPLPGPGWLIIVGGLSIWAQDFHWAARVLSFLRRSIPGLPPEDEGIPWHVWVTLTVSTVAITAFSIWWCLYNGQATMYGWFLSIV